MTLKHCNGCGEDKELNEYWIRSSGKQKGQPYNKCKQCYSGSNKVWRIMNPEKLHVKRKMNPEESRKQHREYRYKRGAKSAANNKSCSAYLGVVIAETVLSHEFPGFKRMPYGNPDYDYECPQGFLIDVKSSCRRHSENGADYWAFATKKNKVANYFLFLAFGNREEPLIPEHIWLVPGRLVNGKTGIAITDSIKNLAKWSEYERSLKNVLECCNKLKGES